MKMKLFQTQIRFLTHDIFNSTIKHIQQSIDFAGKFLGEIQDKNLFVKDFLVLSITL